MQSYVWSVLARRPFQPFWEACHKISVRGMGCNNYASELNGERRVLADVLADLDAERPVVFDVGANEGAFVTNVLSLRPGARVHAFEPNPPTFRRLASRFAGSAVRANPLGVSDKAGTLEIVDYAGAEGSTHASFTPRGMSELRPAGEAERPLVRTPVAVTTLDAYAAENGVDVIDYLKIDVEGHEREVLVGARGLLTTGRVRAIQMEVNAHNAVTGFSLYRIADLLPDFEIFKILPDGAYRIEYRTFHDLFRYANFLFRKKA